MLNSFSKNRLSISQMVPQSLSKICGRLLALGIMAMACCSGCAISPLDFDRSPSTERAFVGFTTEPNELVKIQAEQLDGGWVTLATTRTSETAIPGFAGIRYYYWNRTVDIPQRFWEDRGEFQDRFHQLAKVRVVDSSGRQLYTYRKEVSTPELLTENPLDLWKEKGNSRDYIRVWLETTTPYPF